MTQAEIEKAAHDFVQRLQVRADPWEVSEKTLVELFTKFALAQRKEAVQKLCNELLSRVGLDLDLQQRIQRTIREAFPECFPKEER